jgi:hypothetical protein
VTVASVAVTCCACVLCACVPVPSCSALVLPLLPTANIPTYTATCQMPDARGQSSTTSQSGTIHGHLHSAHTATCGTCTCCRVSFSNPLHHHHQGGQCALDLPKHPDDLMAVQGTRCCQKRLWLWWCLGRKRLWWCLGRKRLLEQLCCGAAVSVVSTVGA